MRSNARARRARAGTIARAMPTVGRKETSPRHIQLMFLLIDNDHVRTHTAKRVATMVVLKNFTTVLLIM